MLALGLVTVDVATAGPSGAATACFGRIPTILAVPGRPTVGTPGDDVILGTPGPDEISGLGGDDRICSRGGADRVDAGGGHDLVALGGGPDVGRGGPGNDLVRGNGGNDRLLGNLGADRLDGGRGRDRLLGGRGADELDGGPGSDTLDGGGGPDALDGGEGADSLLGSGGDDTCEAGAGDAASGCEAMPGPTPVPEPESTPQPDPTPEPQSTPVPDATPTATPDASPTPTPSPTPTATPTPTPSPTPTATPTATPSAVDELKTFIDTSVIGVYGPAFPWLSTAWNHVQAEGTVAVDDIGPPVAGQVFVACSWSTQLLGECGGVAMTMDDGSTESVDVIIHELAHVLETPTGVLADPGPLGMAQLYFNVELGSVCDASEVFADTLLHLTKPDAFLVYYSFGCPALAALHSAPTAEAEAVVASVLAGEDPAWFGANYANGAQAWAAVMTLPLVDRLRVVTNLAGEFGGYCSVEEAMLAGFFGSGDPNPWSDDGCS